MAGQLTIDTLKASTGVLATQNGMTGIIKAWASFSGTTGAVSGSYNISSVTRNGTGDYTANFTTSMPNATYAVSATSYGAVFGAIYGAGDPRTTTSCRFSSVAYNGAVSDAGPVISIAIFSA